MNMCSVRQRPMPSAPNSRALAASSGVSAFARTRSRRSSSAQSRIVPKFSSIAGGTRRTGPMMTRPVPPSIVITSPTLSTCSPIVTVPACASIDEPLAAGHARLAHAARDDGRVRRHAAVRRQHAARLDQAVDVVRRRLPADEDHVVARLAALRGRVGVEHDLARRRAGRRVQALRGDLDDARSGRSSGGAAGRAGPDRSGPPPPRARSAPRPPSRPRPGAPPCAVRLPVRVWSR